MTRRTSSLNAARAAYGVLLLLAPRSLPRRVLGVVPSGPAAAVIRVDGARYLAQAGLVAASGEPGAHRASAAVDAVHAASMVLLSLLAPAGRRMCAAEALVASALAAAEVATARPVSRS